MSTYPHMNFLVTQPISAEPEKLTPLYLEKSGMAVLGKISNSHCCIQIPLALLRAATRAVVGCETVMSVIGRAMSALLDRTSVDANECLDLAVVGARLYSFYLQGKTMCNINEVYNFPL